MERSPPSHCAMICMRGGGEELMNGANLCTDLHLWLRQPRSHCCIIRSVYTLTGWTFNVIQVQSWLGLVTLAVKGHTLCEGSIRHTWHFALTSAECVLPESCEEEENEEEEEEATADTPSQRCNHWKNTSTLAQTHVLTCTHTHTHTAHPHAHLKGLSFQPVIAGCHQGVFTAAQLSMTGQRGSSQVTCVTT